MTSLALLPGFKPHRVRTAGAGIHCVVGGDGPPLLLLHGFPQTHVMWHKIAPQLALHFTVVCSDLRAARGLSLDALATHCGVSRSMISLIERG